MPFGKNKRNALSAAHHNTLQCTPPPRRSQPWRLTFIGIFDKYDALVSAPLPRYNLTTTTHGINYDWCTSDTSRTYDLVWYYKLSRDAFIHHVARFFLEPTPWLVAYAFWALHRDFRPQKESSMPNHVDCKFFVWHEDRSIAIHDLYTRAVDNATETESLSSFIQQTKTDEDWISSFLDRTYVRLRYIERSKDNLPQYNTITHSLVNKSKDATIQLTPAPDSEQDILRNIELAL